MDDVYRRITNYLTNDHLRQKWTVKKDEDVDIVIVYRVKELAFSVNADSALPMVLEQRGADDDLDLPLEKRKLQQLQPQNQRIETEEDREI